METYAFLDPGSTASFCTEALLQDLTVPGRRAGHSSQDYQKVVTLCSEARKKRDRELPMNLKQTYPKT